jgi:LysM repeat protein
MATVSKFQKTLLLSVALVLSARAYGFTVVVKQGDTLSELAQRYLGSPVYPKGGSLARLKADNPEVKESNLLLPGQTLEIGKRSPPALAAPSILSDSPERVPAGTEAVPATEPTVSDAGDQSVVVTPELLYTQIYARDKANGGSLRATDGNYGIHLGYSQKWSQDFSLYARVNWYRIDLKSPFPGASTSAKNSYTGFSIGSKHRLGEAWAIRTRLGYQEEPVVTAISLTSLGIDRVGLLEAGFGVLHRFSESSNGHFSLWGELGGSMSLPAKTQSYDVDLGSVLYARISTRSKLSKHSALELGPYYRRQVLKTNLIDQTLTSFGLGAQFQWEFGE